MKTFIVAIKENIRILKAQQTLSMVMCLPEQRQEHGKTVFFSNTIMAAGGCRIACAKMGSTGNPYILIDEEFYALPVGVQKFLIAHEEGHIELSHFDRLEGSGLTVMRDRLKKIKKGKVMDIELEADDYAAEQIGYDEAIAALWYLQSYLIKKGGKKSLPVKEITYRVKALHESFGFEIESRCVAMNGKLDQLDRRIAALV